MELRRYWATLWRHRWIVLALPLLVLLVSLLIWALKPPSYGAELKLQLVLAPPQGTNAGDFFHYDNYYNYLATEYAVDDLVEVLNGNVFANAVAATLRGPDFGLSEVKDEDIRGSFLARRTHRVLIVDITSGNRDRTLAISRAIALTLQRDPVKYFTKGDLVPQQGAAPLTIEQPIEARGDRAKRLLNVALQTVIALFAAIALAFLLDYLNDRLRDADGTGKALGLPVLGAIPDGDAGGRRRGLLAPGRAGGA
jgi:capsular polysaccharide biosynthesis protein